MAKRFTDSEKWKNPFLRNLPSAYKLFWIYLNDECDHAGFWIVDLEVAQIKMGETIDPDMALELFKGRVFDMGDGTWFVKEFVSFQYGELNYENRAHKSVIDKIEKAKADRKMRQNDKPLIKPLTSPLLGAMDKDKEKDKEKGLTGARAEKFKVFWEAFNNKQGKSDAVKAWAKLSEDEMDKAIAAAGPYHERIKKKPDSVQKFAQGWLNGKRWEDEVSSTGYGPAPIYTPPPQVRNYTRLIDWLKAHPNAVEPGMIYEFMKAGIDPSDHGACRRWLAETGYPMGEATQFVYSTNAWMERMGKL